MPAGFITTFYIPASIQVWATMRNISAWDVAPKDNLVVAALDVTSEESVENLVKEIIKQEGDSKIFCIIAHCGHEYWQAWFEIRSPEIAFMWIKLETNLTFVIVLMRIEYETF